MNTTLSIGDFARATHLSVKALRHYHQEGLLEPAEIDFRSGYRRYDLAQIPSAQVIRRLRALDMPLEDIRSILRAEDVAERSDLIARHLLRLEGELERTRAAAASLRDLLEHPKSEFPVEHRHIPEMRAAAIAKEVDAEEFGAWYNGALGELYATLSAQSVPLAGEAGGMYADSLFREGHGMATVYLPVEGSPPTAGRIQLIDLPSAELAVILHKGPVQGIDRAYGTLADYVTRHALSTAGPIREFYPVNRHHTGDSSHWCTMIGWPVFRTKPSF
ncbi:MerR family transcriptional regulator [Streptomyces sp. NBC_01497]|uniref:MerR family transcriptional regulator n=1 Tax=Streptomyces sp. NBC_01497 TaxID=2903885 RepID=UPI002E3458FB|nr:MerR family transcriptional regulator [Streptomyces sp. NBC_01497]